MFQETSPTGVSDDPFEWCAQCGASFELGVTFPVETRIRPDGTLELYSFCDEDCQHVWNAQRAP